MLLIKYQPNTNNISLNPVGSIYRNANEIRNLFQNIARLKHSIPYMQVVFFGIGVFTPEQ